jgi:hypothetical protein
MKNPLREFGLSFSEIQGESVTGELRVTMKTFVALISKGRLLGPNETIFSIKLLIRSSMKLTSVIWAKRGDQL